MCTRELKAGKRRLRGHREFLSTHANRRVQLKELKAEKRRLRGSREFSTMVLSTHANRPVPLTADGKSPPRCITLIQITPGIMIDLLFDVHEGAKSRKKELPGNLVLDTNFRFGPLLTCK